MNKNKNTKETEKITRKQAIKKAGVTALTAATLVFLETKASAQTSQDSAPTPGTGW